ncbi:MAG: 3-hydroxyacyl-CoA dehydrogenase NAD-binding domain-containing protein [Sphingobacteriales bacterium]|nr:3-hydroxyacyl-CoA dehydrogenase NAD-binding domain-containing protein [Sphingobacteriales bacterium]
MMFENKRAFVAGAGAMGQGIAQVFAQAGWNVWLFDNRPNAAAQAKLSVASALDKLVAKGKMESALADEVKSRIHTATSLQDAAEASLFIEAVIEDLDVKKNLFAEVESIVNQSAVLATNTSSLSVTSIASACAHPGRVVGIHFFNPAPLMPLVEVIPAIQTAEGLALRIADEVKAWGKIPVVAKDTPGFIVNRLARPYYGESLRILEEGIADIPSIDHALKSIGGFRMGPFELMDLIGNDVNYTVSETVWSQFYYDPRYRPSLIQRRMKEAGFLGKKSGRGYYDYAEQATNPGPSGDEQIWNLVFMRVISMLVNEAAEALLLGVASASALDLAMTKGVNYPKGLLAWGDEIGPERILACLDNLQSKYGDDRYRASSLLRERVASGKPLFG